MPKENKEPITFSITPTLAGQLKGYAARRGCSASTLAEVAIRAYLRDRKVPE